MEARAAAEALYTAVTSALSAQRLVREACAAAPLSGGGRLLLLGLGKVARDMLAGTVDALDPERLSGLLVVPGPLTAEERWGAAGTEGGGPAWAVAPRAPGVQLWPGVHPVPGEESLAAGEALLRAASGARPRDGVLLLLSGGGSALAEAPAAGLDLLDMQGLNRELLRSGAPIEEMNCIRAHLSRLKGGGLARALHAAGVVRARALVLVDVPRGGYASVSSGPAAADPTRFADALAIVRARRMVLPAAAQSALEEGLRGERAETLKQGEPAAQLTEHEILCDMSSPALAAARQLADEGTVEAAWIERLPEPVAGPLEALALQFEARLASWAGSHPSAPRALLASGEVELVVPSGAPAGGRCQHLALRLARALRGGPGAFLAAGTDGRDGATPYLGALVTGATWDEALLRGLDPQRALDAGAATPLLEALGALLPARATGAHAGDLYALLSAASA